MSVGAVTGVAAGIAGLGVAQLVAGLLAPASAPLVALGDLTVDITPTWLREWAIATFGTADKQVLLGGALLVALLLSAAAGVLAVRRSRFAVWVVLGLGAIAASAAATRPDAGMLAVLPSVAGAVAGTAVLIALADLVNDRPVDVTDRPVEPQAAAGPARLLGRRALAGLGAAAFGGVLLAGAGQLLGRRLRGARESRQAVRLPAPTSPAPPVPPGVELGVPGLAPFFTPTADFYRIDTALVTPLLRAEDWSLRVHGLVEREVTLSYPDLLAAGLVERDVTLMCVSNPIGGNLTGNARWLGLPIKGLLERAGPRAGADMVLSTSSDGWTAGTPLSVLTDGRDCLLAVGMNGAPLPFEHGFPVRMVVPGLYGYVSATKWVVDLEVTRFDQASGYWTPRGWSPLGPVKTGSRFDVPKDGAGLAPGPVTLAGVAWQQHVGIERVEVRVDDGPWQEATLGAEDSVDTWRQWSYRWEATAGRHELQVRATNRQGRPQTEQRADVIPDGATGWHTIEVTVG